MIVAGGDATKRRRSMAGAEGQRSRCGATVLQRCAIRRGPKGGQRVASPAIASGFDLADTFGGRQSFRAGPIGHAGRDDENFWTIALEIAQYHLQHRPRVRIEPLLWRRMTIAAEWDANSLDAYNTGTAQTMRFEPLGVLVATLDRVAKIGRQT